MDKLAYKQLEAALNDAVDYACETVPIPEGLGSCTIDCGVAPEGRHFWIRVTVYGKHRDHYEPRYFFNSDWIHRLDQLREEIAFSLDIVLKNALIKARKKGMRDYE